MSLKIKFQRLEYQEKAVNSLVKVFENIGFKQSDNGKSNPVFDSWEVSRQKLFENIKSVRAENEVAVGACDIRDALSLDILMETGTGKTFTFIESIYRLNKEYGLSKFIIMTPSNAIRQGTIKNLSITKEFFAKEYEKSISTYNYSASTVQNYINNSNQNISVLILTHQSFSGKDNIIHQNKIEQSLIGKATSYMEAIAALRPVVIIDEPHRFEGKNTLANLDKFNPLFTMRFGATFKNDAYLNLLYTLDSVAAFKGGYVKNITVDTVSHDDVDGHVIELDSVAGAKEADYEATIHINKKAYKLKKGDSLGDKAKMDTLDGYIVEKITKNLVQFTNGFELLLREPASYSLMMEKIQQTIILNGIQRHFAKEEMLFRRGIKALTLFFIDSVNKYLLDDGTKGKLAQKFEELYEIELGKVLKTEIDPSYREYLEKTKDEISKVHNGYFAKSNKDKEQEKAIDLILNAKEDLLSFKTDLRFIFSMWALQEGWDNPNVFTLCKLAPSSSKITKLQQIGRGLRLAVNQDGNRITKDNIDFELVNMLDVVVPSSEGDFVESIQTEILSKSITKISKSVSIDVFVQNGVVKNATNVRAANKFLDLLVDKSVISLDEETSEGEIIITKEGYDEISTELISEASKNTIVDIDKLKSFFNSYFVGKTHVKKREDIKPRIKIDPAKYAKFKTLWENLNRNATMKYEINTEMLINNIVSAINKDFEIKEQEIIVRRQRNAQDATIMTSTTDSIGIVETQSTMTILEFIKELANQTKLSLSTIGAMLQKIDKSKFEMLSKNENLAISKLAAICMEELYALMVEKVSYEVLEVHCKTTLTDEKGNVLGSIAGGSLGKETYLINNKEVKKRSIYAENFMEVDSTIEKDTIDESNDTKITVFGKLPHISLPTPVGAYNPDFGYVVEDKNKKELYLVVETKGYDDENKIPKKEQRKIDSAKKFFEALKSTDGGIDVSFKTKINKQQLSDMVEEICRK